MNIFKCSNCPNVPPCFLFFDYGEEEGGPRTPERCPYEGNNVSKWEQIEYPEHNDDDRYIIGMMNHGATKIPCIKEYRRVTSTGLKEAKERVEELADSINHKWPHGSY